MKTVLRSVLVLIPVVLMLTLMLGLCLASLQGPKILWTAIDGELVTLDLTERSHVCHVSIRARDGGLLRYSLDGDICTERIGSRIHKAPWSISVRSTSANAYPQMGPVLAGAAGALWTALLGSLLFYATFVRSVRDWLGGRGSRSLPAVGAHERTRRRIPRWLLAWQVVAMCCAFVAVFFGFVIVAIGEDQPRGAWNYPVSILGAWTIAWVVTVVVMRRK